MGKYIPWVEGVKKSSGELAKKNRDFLTSFAGSQGLIKENGPMELVIIL